MFRTVPPPFQRLLVFARLPELGKVKTRIAAELGDDEALAVYEAMLRDVLGRIGTSDGDTEVEFLWAPTPAANGAALRRAFGQHAVAMQTGDTLGDRMSMALSERFFFHRTEKIVVIGVDNPTIDREFLNHAFALLDSCEYVIGPADDGGYYLIGCRALAYDPIVFDGIAWGTSTVFRATMERIAQIGRSVAVLPQRHDIDTAADLERFASGNTEGELARLLGEGA